MKLLRVISLSFLVLLSASGVMATKGHCENMTNGSALSDLTSQAFTEDESSDYHCQSTYRSVFLVYTATKLSDRDPSPIPSKERIKQSESFQQLRLKRAIFKPQVFLSSTRPFYKPMIFKQVQSFLL